MLRAVAVPCCDLEQDRLFRLGLVIIRHQRGRQRRIVLDHARLAPDLDPAAIDIVDQENIRLRVLAEIALRDVLPVAAVICEGQRGLVENLDEARRAAAMLDVGLTIGVRRRQEETRLLADEGGEGRINLGAKTAAVFHMGVATARTLSGLNGLHGGRESDVAGIGVGACHGGPPCPVGRIVLI